MAYFVRGAALVYAGLLVGTQVAVPSLSSALSLGFVLSAWIGFEVLDYFDRRGKRVDDEVRNELRMTSEVMVKLSVRLDELEPRVQRIDNRTRRAGEP